MLRTVCLSLAASALLSTTALADYYVVQEKTTRECKIVETRPVGRYGQNLVFSDGHASGIYVNDLLRVLGK